MVRILHDNFAGLVISSSRIRWKRLQRKQKKNEEAESLSAAKEEVKGGPSIAKPAPLVYKVPRTAKRKAKRRLRRRLALEIIEQGFDRVGPPRRVERRETGEIYGVCHIKALPR